MVRSDKASSGVMFSIDTESGFKNAVLLTASYGLGENIVQGSQNDGYHVLRASKPIGLIISGFDKHVSYGYVGGMDMRRINVQ